MIVTNSSSIEQRNWFRVAVLIALGICCFSSTVQSQPTTSAAAVLDHINDYHDVTVLGLGSMGQAFVKCLLKDSNLTKVHAWNRGTDKRDTVRDMGATTYETAEAAVQASNVTLVLIDDWDGIIQLITKDMNRDVWSGKVVVLFSTYSPTDIIKLQNEYFIDDPTTVLVGAAIVAEPQTVCSPHALVLLSTDIPQIKNIGRIEVFNGNVGYAALVNMAIILVVTFGIAGQELAHLILRQYGVTSKEFYDTYVPLSTEVGTTYTKMLLPIVSNSIITKEYEKSYVPVGTFANVLQMQVKFMKDIGIADDTFLTSYLKYLNKVTNMKYGPAAWIEEAVETSDEKKKDQEL